MFTDFFSLRWGEKDTLRVRKEIVEDYIRDMGSWSKNKWLWSWD
jgi:hypothetical protein